MSGGIEDLVGEKVEWFNEDGQRYTGKVLAASLLKADGTLTVEVLSPGRYGSWRVEIDKVVPVEKDGGSV